MSCKFTSPPSHEFVVDELANSWDKHRRGWLSLADISQAQHFHGTASKVCDWDLLATHTLLGRQWGCVRGFEQCNHAIRVQELSM